MCDMDMAVCAESGVAAALVPAVRGFEAEADGLDLKLEHLELRRACGLILMPLRHRDREALVGHLVRERAVYVHVHMRVHVRFQRESGAVTKNCPAKWNDCPCRFIG